MEIEESQGQELRNYNDFYITFARTDQSLFSAIEPPRAMERVA